LELCFSRTFTPAYIPILPTTNGCLPGIQSYVNTASPSLSAGFGLVFFFTRLDSYLRLWISLALACRVVRDCCRCRHHYRVVQNTGTCCNIVLWYYWRLMRRDGIYCYYYYRHHRHRPRTHTVCASNPSSRSPIVIIWSPTVYLAHNNVHMILYIYIYARSLGHTVCTARCISTTHSILLLSSEGASKAFV